MPRPHVRLMFLFLRSGFKWLWSNRLSHSRGHVLDCLILSAMIYEGWSITPLIYIPSAGKATSLASFYSITKLWTSRAPQIIHQLDFCRGKICCIFYVGFSGRWKSNRELNGIEQNFIDDLVYWMPNTFYFLIFFPQIFFLNFFQSLNFFKVMRV